MQPFKILADQTVKRYSENITCDFQLSSKKSVTLVYMRHDRCAAVWLPIYTVSTASPDKTRCRQTKHLTIMAQATTNDESATP